MATTAASQRITRLKSREASAKALSERKLEPRKIIAIKNAKKVNVSVRGKSVRVSKKNISLRKNQVSPIRLRPRRNKKNYCEDSKLLQQYISPKQQDSMVILEKLHLEGNRKVPVYRTIKPSEKFSEDKNDVYDFKFDANDVKEKSIKKKQKKRNVNKGKSKMKKATRKKVTAQSKTIGCDVIQSKPDANLPMEIAQSNPPLKFVATRSTKQDNVKKTKILNLDRDIQTREESINKDIEGEIEPPRIDTDIQTLEKSTEDIVENMEMPRADTNIQEETTLAGTFVDQIAKENKPRVISIENANNIIVTKSPSNDTGDSRPFQPKNIFDNKTSSKEHNSTLKYSLMKTLSPILKTTNTLDFGSPWRPPTLTFSQTKHFIQSTPYKNFEINKENKEISKKSMETNKENMEMDKENMNIDKENKGRRDKERKKKTVGLRKKHTIQKKLPISENQDPEKIQAVVASKSTVPSQAPARISLGEIKNLLLRSNVTGDNKQTNQMHTEVDKSSIEQTNKQLVDFLNFSDTFDVLSETEKLSNIGNDVPLFMDLEPSHFSKPPQHSYRRKRAVKFDFSEDSGEEENKNIKLQQKKKKRTKLQKEHERRINEWVKTVNTTFEEIDKHDLLIE